MFAIIIMWFWWFLDIILLVIVMLNFVIAEVGQVYERVNTSGITFLYTERAEMNEKTLAFKYYLGKLFKYFALPSFQFIVITSPAVKEADPSQEEDEFFGFTNKIKKDVGFMLKFSKKQLRRTLGVVTKGINDAKKTIDSATRLALA